MTKHLLACGLLLLCLTACKGRHADGTPTGETVEVNIEAPEATDVQVIETQPSQPTSDSETIEAPTADTTVPAAAPALTGRPQ